MNLDYNKKPDLKSIIEQAAMKIISNIVEQYRDRADDVLSIMTDPRFQALDPMICRHVALKLIINRGGFKYLSEYDNSQEEINALENDLIEAATEEGTRIMFIFIAPHLKSLAVYKDTSFKDIQAGDIPLSIRDIYGQVWGIHLPELASEEYSEKLSSLIRNRLQNENTSHLFQEGYLNDIEALSALLGITGSLEELRTEWYRRVQSTKSRRRQITLDFLTAKYKKVPQTDGSFIDYYSANEISEYFGERMWAHDYIPMAKKAGVWRDYWVIEETDIKRATLPYKFYHPEFFKFIESIRDPELSEGYGFIWEYCAGDSELYDYVSNVIRLNEEVRVQVKYVAKGDRTLVSLPTILLDKIVTEYNVRRKKFNERKAELIKQGYVHRRAFGKKDEKGTIYNIGINSIALVKAYERGDFEGLRAEMLEGASLKGGLFVHPEDMFKIYHLLKDGEYFVEDLVSILEKQHPPFNSEISTEAIRKLMNSSINNYSPDTSRDLTAKITSNGQTVIGGFIRNVVTYDGVIEWYKQNIAASGFMYDGKARKFISDKHNLDEPSREELKTLMREAFRDGSLISQISKGRRGNNAPRIVDFDYVYSWYLENFQNNNSMLFIGKAIDILSTRYHLNDKDKAILKIWLEEAIQQYPEFFEVVVDPRGLIINFSKVEEWYKSIL